MTSLAQLFRRSSPEIMFLARSAAALLSIIDPHQSPKMYRICWLAAGPPADIVELGQRSTAQLRRALVHCCRLLCHRRDTPSRHPMQTTLPRELSTPPSCI